MPEGGLWRPGGDFPWLVQMPPTPVEGDGTTWFDGPCMLYCQGALRRVFYAGTIHVPGAKSPAQICAQCAATMQDVVLSVRLRDDLLHVRHPPSGEGL